jgi:hypothetical protein
LFCDTTPPIPINGIDPDVRPDMVRFVVVAYELFKSVMVEDAEVRSEIVVVARLELPSTVRVPCEIRDEVAVIEPPVIDENIAVIPETRLVKKLVDVALSKNAFLAKRLVEVLLVVDAFNAIRVSLTVVLSVVRLVIVPVDEVN